MQPGAGNSQPKQHMNSLLAMLILIMAIALIGGLMWVYSRPVPSPMHIVPTDIVTDGDPSGPTPHPHPPKSPQEKAHDRQVCLDHLRAISKALIAYRRDHPSPKTRGLPEHLSDLVGKYLKDPTVFLCPADVADAAIAGVLTGRAQPRNSGVPYTSYAYFGGVPVYVERGPEWGCPNCTWYDWLDLRGGEAPLVVCTHHATLATATEAGTIGPFFIIRLGGRVESRRVPVGLKSTQY